MKMYARALSSSAALIVLLVLAACESVFDHSVPGLPISLEPYLGTWTLVELLGAAPASQTLVHIETDAAGNLVIRVSDAAGTAEVPATLVALGDATLLSIMNRNGTWQVFNVFFVEGEYRLAIEMINFDALRDDVAAGAIAGEVLGRDDLVRITAEPESLSGYFEERPGVFSGTAALLERNGTE